MFNNSVSRCEDFLAGYSAVQGLDQCLHLGELVACPLGSIAIKGGGQHLRMGVPVLDHAFTGFFQRCKAFAHFGTFAFMLFTPAGRPSVEIGRKLTLTEDNYRFVVIVAHFGISRRREGDNAYLVQGQSLGRS